LDVTPDPFSPNGDGFEDVTIIKYNPPEADRFEMAIYDLAGRKVKTFFEDDLSIPGEILWDGRGDDGRTLGIGIYILYAQTEGGTSAKTKRTVVIAR
jgi:flagellar hook assembly protein FlgD